MSADADRQRALPPSQRRSAAPVKAGGLNRKGASGGRGRATRIGAVRSLDSTEVRGWAKTQGTEVEDRRPVLTELGVKAKAATAH